MLPLDSPMWGRINHCYGPATDTPRLLQELEAVPPEGVVDGEPYFSLWSSLCHQGDVYVASYAAAPHIVRVLKQAGPAATPSLLHLPAQIEIARQSGRGPELTDPFAGPYRAALQDLGVLAAALAPHAMDPSTLRVCLGAIAVSRGQVQLGKAIIDLSPDVLALFDDWVDNL